MYRTLLDEHLLAMTELKGNNKLVYYFYGIVRCFLSLSQAFLSSTELKYLVSSANLIQDRLLN